MFWDKGVILTHTLGQRVTAQWHQSREEGGLGVYSSSACWWSPSAGGAVPSSKWHIVPISLQLRDPVLSEELLGKLSLYGILAFSFFLNGAIPPAATGTRAP